MPVMLSAIVGPVICGSSGSMNIEETPENDWATAS